MTNKILSKLIGGVVGVSLLFGGSCSDYIQFGNYRISKEYDELIQKNVYILKRPDEFSCTIIEGQEEVLISKGKEETNFLRPKYAHAAGTMSGGAIIVPIMGAAANSARIARERREKKEREHKKRLEALTKEDKIKISNECQGVLKEYLLSKISKE